MVDGTKVNYKIPDGTQPGTKFVIKIKVLKQWMEIIKVILFWGTSSSSKTFKQRTKRAFSSTC